MRRSAPLGILALTLTTVAACGSSHPDKAASAPSAARATSATTTSGGACAFTTTRASTGSKPPPGLPAQPTGAAPATMTLQLSAVTKGTLTIALDPKAPCTDASFAHLAGVGFLDGTSCHRLTTSGIYVLQYGDPTGTGSGGPGYTIPDENLGATELPAGTIAMANAGAGTGGSQFFICYQATQLPPSYTPFGQVTAGLDLIQAVAAKGSDNATGPGDGAPKAPVTIVKATVS